MFRVTTNDWMMGHNEYGFEKVQRFANNTLRKMWSAGMIPNPKSKEESLCYFSPKYLVVNIDDNKTLKMNFTVINEDRKLVPVTVTFNAGIEFSYHLENEEDRWGYYVDDCWVTVPFNISVIYDNNVTDEEDAEIMAIFYQILKED